jgi:Zn-dependent peptidase ImmA (M78 family)
MNSNTQLPNKTTKETWDSYIEIRKTYESFKEIRKRLGIPTRTIFNTEATKGDVRGIEFLEAMKQLKEKEKTPSV